MMVVLPRQEGPRGLEKPRVISEIRKCNKKTQHVDSKPRLSGSLEWGTDGNTAWQPRLVEVRDGSLVMLASPTGCPELRIPLRHLNLQPGGRPRAFCLSRGQAAPVASFQAGNQQEYERWVKTLAVELMRQTPLEAIRFLDILGITTTLHPTGLELHQPLRRGASEDNLSTLTADTRPRRTRVFGTRNNNCVVPRTPIESRINRDNLGGKFRIGGSLLKRGYYDFIENDLRGNGKVICEENEGLLEKRQNNENVCNKSVTGIFGSDSESDDYEREFAELIVKCQQVDNYVPVREKRRLFESLCQGRRLAQSTENLSGMISLTQVTLGQLRRSTRAQSLHDLSRLRCSVAVSEICRYFEQRGRGADEGGGTRWLGRNDGRRRLQRSERRLTRIKQETAEVEEELWRIQDEMAVLDKARSAQDGAIVDRSLALQSYHALEAHLTQEEERLSRLQTEAARVLKEVELAANKFESTLVQGNGENAEKNNSRQ